MHILGIDIGTTNTKAAVYNLEGKCVASTARKTETYHPVPEYSEHDPEEIWANVVSCIQELRQKVRDWEVAGVGVTSFGEAGVPLDINGNILSSMIAWYDPRAFQQEEWLERVLGKEKIYRITGQLLSSKFGIAKVLWLRENCPAVFEKCVKWLSMEDYIIYRLSGEFATDYSIAARTLLMDIHRLDWSDEILARIGLAKSLLPRLYPGATTVGQVTAKAAAETGLEKGIAVVTGGHDHSCAAMGVKIFEPGVILDSMGTAEATVTAIAKPLLSRESLIHRISAYPHCGQPLYRILTSIQSCGAAIEWYLAKFGKALGGDMESLSLNRYEGLMDAAKESPPGALGLYFIPHIRGLLGHPHATGAFVGLRDTHGFGEFARAIIEGLCFDARDRLESCERIYHSANSTIRVVGGASKSEFWMQTKADILGKVVEIPENEDAASFGGALMAAVGAGIFKNAQEAAEHMYHPKKRYYPRENVNKMFDQKYGQFVRINQLLINIADEEESSFK
jgi:xylulokinase